MKLLGSSASPFVAKVRMASVVCGIELDLEKVETIDPPKHLVEANPLAKIPVLLTDENEAVFDSNVICEVLDRMSGNLLIPQTMDGYREAKTFEAVVNGTKDALVLCVYEERFRPEEKRHTEWTRRQMARADRGLEWLRSKLDGLGDQPDIRHCALASLVGWMELRFKDKLDADAPQLAAWARTFFDKNPSIAAMKSSLS